MRPQKADKLNIAMNLNHFKKQAILLAGLLLIITLVGCGDDNTTTEIAEPAETNVLQPDQVTTNAHIYLYKGGHQTTDLLADTIWQFTRLDSALATNLFVEFFDTTGTKISTLTAQHGYIREKDNFLAVSGSVVVVGEDSVRLESEYLEWDGAKDSIVTDSFVTIIEGPDTLMSYGFQSDPRLKNVTFKNQVSGRLTDVDKIQDEDN